MKAKFLSTRPNGEDLLNGKSQDYIANAIMRHIEMVDAEEDSTITIPRIIGVEGIWGLGKSNMLVKLEDKLKSKYYFFTYDAWGNQEDLQRRSILEQLTDELIEKEKLVKDTVITILDTDLDKEPTIKKCTWKRRLFTLIARKSTTHNVTVPKMESSTKAFALSLLITAIIPTIMDVLKPEQSSIWYWIVTLVAIFIPLIIFLLCMWIKKWEWKEMWKMYQTEGVSDTATYTVSELEPSVTEFRKWLNDLAESLAEDMHLVIVFDNMDRLPREKVRQLWSSIQTFFAGKDYSKIWCIIPFDREHLANAFAEENVEEEKKLELTNYFIEKTFPVIYSVPAPIITDYRAVFNKLFIKAFGDIQERELINRCYRLKYKKPNMRGMISFINKCVAQHNIWKDEIRLTSIALFELNKDIIFNDNNQDEIIITGKYIGKFKGIIECDETLPIEIASLVYGVPKQMSAQLPLKNFIEEALTKNEEVDFDKYAHEQPEFFVILDEVICGMDPSYLDNAINHISTICKENVIGNNLDLLDKIWLRLGNEYIKKEQNENSFRNEVQLMINNCSIQYVKEQIAKKFIELFALNENNEHSGEEWFICYKRFDAFTKENVINIQLPEIYLKAETFVDYIKSAQSEYIQFPIYCENIELNEYVINQINDGNDISESIKLLNEDKRYNLNDILTNARELIETKSAKDNNIVAVLNMCKVLSTEPLKLNTTLDYLNTFTHNGAVLYDLQLLRALVGKEVSGVDDTYYAKLAEVSYVYADTYDIWSKTLTSSTNVIRKVMACLINKNYHCGDSNNVKDMLTEMSRIKQLTNVEYSSIIRFVNDWGRGNLNDIENKVVLSNVFNDERWCKTLNEEDCQLSKIILEKFYHDFKQQPITAFMTSNNTWGMLTNSYWLRVLNVLIDSNEFKYTCKDKLEEIVTHVIEGICTKNITSNSDNMELQSKLLLWVDFEKVSSKVIDVMDKFGNSRTINTFMFISLHHLFEKTRGFETKYLNYILKPIITNVDVQQIILDNLDFYENLLGENMDQASDLKTEIIKLYETSENDKFKNLIERLEILPKIR
jgi:hypothetical protein